MSDSDQGMEPRVLHSHHHPHPHPHPALYTHGHVHPHNMSHAPITGHQHEMHMQSHSEADVHNESQSHMDHGNMHLRFMHGHDVGHSLQHGEENEFGDDGQDDVGDEEGLEEAEMQPDGDNLVDPQSSLMARSQGNTQLSLSYQGEVYVFDTVPPEKVQAVLLLLGGREIPQGMSSVPLQGHHQSKGMPQAPQRLNMTQRMASLIRFREKRKERNFDKKIRYTVRKEVALRMQRHKGQFAPAKSTNPEGYNVEEWEKSDSWANQSAGVVDNNQEEIKCLHCGTQEKSTPMMRRGPSGPRTLCNACGLMWANKGVLRDLGKPLNPVGTSQRTLMHS